MRSDAHHPVTAMTDEDLIGYALDLLDPAERAAVEAGVAADPDAAARLDRVRRAVAPLAADRADDDPPPGLALRTIGRMAAYLVEHEPRTPAAEPAKRVPPPADDPEVRTFGGRLRFDILVAAGIGFLAFGLIVSGVTRARHQSQMMACQSNLRELHRGLTGYAEVRHGQFPQVGDVRHPTAGAFVAALSEAGQFPPGFRPTCPAAPRPDPLLPVVAAIGYTYTLGYRDPAGELMGLRRSDAPADENDLIPISADYPAAGVVPAGGPVSPHGSVMSVLYVGGHVRPTVSPLVGPGGDDIYCNRDGRVAAGVDRTDAVLGRPQDRP
jgi:hypothetical protein